MNVRSTRIPEVLVIEPAVFQDARGSFHELFHQRRFSEAGLPVEFVQDNLSVSRRGTIRGMHFQKRRPQGKLVQAVRGAVFDVAVDLRRGSKTFGHWVGETLSDENHRQIYLPAGFAHGFCALTDNAVVLYKCTGFYQPDDERTLLWNDPAIGIEWPEVAPTIISEKDQHGLPLATIDAFEWDGQAWL